MANNYTEVIDMSMRSGDTTQADQAAQVDPNDFAYGWRLLKGEDGEPARYEFTKVFDRTTNEFCNDDRYLPINSVEDLRKNVIPIFKIVPTDYNHETSLARTPQDIVNNVNAAFNGILPAFFVKAEADEVKTGSILANDSIIERGYIDSIKQQYIFVYPGESPSCVTIKQSQAFNIELHKLLFGKELPKLVPEGEGDEKTFDATYPSELGLVGICAGEIDFCLVAEKRYEPKVTELELDDQRKSYFNIASGVLGGIAMIALFFAFISPIAAAIVSGVAVVLAIASQVIKRVTTKSEREIESIKDAKYNREYPVLTTELQQQLQQNLQNQQDPSAQQNSSDLKDPLASQNSFDPQVT
jgi:hypothetical protein